MRVYSPIGLAAGSGATGFDSENMPPAAGANGSRGVPAAADGEGNGALGPGADPACMNRRVNSPGSVDLGGGAGGGDNGAFGRCTKLVRARSGFDGRSPVRPGSAAGFRSGGGAA